MGNPSYHPSGIAFDITDKGVSEGKAYSLHPTGSKRHTTSSSNPHYHLTFF